MSERNLHQLIEERAEFSGEPEWLNARFSLEINQKLHELIPNADKYPLIYIGSGGDVVSAMLVSGADRILMIDRHYFMTKTGQKNDGSELFTSMDELYQSTDPDNETVGVLTYWSSVRPAQQLLGHLQRLGIPRERIDIHTDGRDATIQIHLTHRVINVDYISEGFRDLRELNEQLNHLNIQEYGVLVKGGADGAFQDALQAADEGERRPRFIIADDPQFGPHERITPKEEAELYPGYQLQEVTSSYDTGWGYSRPKNGPGGYKTRAVIGVVQK